MKRASESTSSNQKRLAISSLTRQSCVSQRALSNILKDVEQHGIPVAFSRASQYRAKKTIIEQASLVEVQSFDLKIKNKVITHKVSFLKPIEYLQYLCKHSNAYAEAMLYALDTTPPSPTTPWNVILYQDGVDPGDGLTKEKSRHSAVFYWSLFELGMDALSHEEFWSPAAIIRTDIAKKIGLQVVSYRVAEMFHKARDIFIQGVTLEMGLQQFRLFAHIQVLLADAPALAEMTGSKGHAGLKNCCLCMNATNPRPPGGATPMHMYSAYCHPTTECDYSKFRKHTNRSLRGLYRRLSEIQRTKTPAELEHQETNVFGYTWSPHNILADPRFRVLPDNDKIVTSIYYDWAHIFLQGGDCDNEIGEFMRQMHRATTQEGIAHSCTYMKFGEYYSRWTLPKGRNPLEKLFDQEHQTRFINSGTFSSAASELLDITPIFKRYLERVVLHEVDGTRMSDHVKSMIACLDVVLLCQKARRRGAVDPDYFERAVAHHMSLCKRVYGDDFLKPKHHYALHLADQLRAFGCLLSCFVHERKHRAVIRYAKIRCTLQQFDSLVLEEVICHNIWELSDAFHRYAFSNAHPTRIQTWQLQELFPDDPAAVFTLHNAVYRNGHVTRGDVVAFIHDGAIRYGELAFSVSVITSSSSNIFSFVTLWETAHGDDGYMNCRSIADAPLLRIDVGQLRAPCTYAMSKDRSSCVLLVPPHV